MPSPRPEPPPDLDIEQIQKDLHDAAGIDVSQIDRMLALTPRERLAVLETSADSLCRVMRRAERRSNL
jgi:hypothetical protein